jgi:hypothetical protein
MNKLLLCIALILCGSVASAQDVGKKCYIESTGTHVGKVRLNDNCIVRLLILKHARESLAEKDHREMLQAVDFGKSSGLTIQELGGHHIDKDGVHENIVWGKICSLQDLKAFINEQMKAHAVKGDTFLIYTTGHGSPSGYLATLGMRKDIQRIFAECAEENNQETLWWQSSCYAAAGLTPINQLPERQQNLFSMIASSDAEHVSYWGHCVRPMREMFEALGKENSEIDPNQDGEITCNELRKFLKNSKKELILFSKSEEEPIFGVFGPWNIPVIDRLEQQGDYKRDYIPVPNGS